MLKNITKAITALGALCLTLHKNPDGARVMLALGVLAFSAFAL
jgi:hypothetical protein